jgi:hypothetical protein
MLHLKYRNYGDHTLTARFINIIEISLCSNASNYISIVRGNPAKLLKGINPL